jgi:Lysozyme like domain
MIYLAIIVLGIFLYEEFGSTVTGNLTITDYARNAGFSGVDLITAVAIAFAESSGNANASNTVPPDNSYGLWQINLNAHPEYSLPDILDPQTNANAAFAIYSAAGNSFKPWSTFLSGAYQQYLPPSGDDQTASADNGDDDGEDA